MAQGDNNFQWLIRLVLYFETFQSEMKMSENDFWLNLFKMHQFQFIPKKELTGVKWTV